MLGAAQRNVDASYQCFGKVLWGIVFLTQDTVGNLGWLEISGASRQVCTQDPKFLLLVGICL